MLFSPALSLLISQLPKDVHPPAEGVVVSRVTVQLVEGLKFCVGDDEVYKTISIMRNQSFIVILPWKLLSMREGVTLLGSTAVPRWIAHEISSWAGSLFSFLATSATVGSSITLWV